MRKALQSLARGWARRLGLELIPAWRMQRLPLATHVARVLADRDVQCVLDVGANVGQYRDFLRQEVGYAGPIVSFEPVAASFARIAERACGDDGWHVVQVALGAARGSAEIHVMAGSEFSSLHRPRADGPQYRLNVVRHAETVPVRRLDELAEELGALVPLDRVYLKIDTQGHDLAVIEGAEGMMECVVALQTEMAVVPVYEDAPRYPEAIGALEARGYALSGMFPVAQDDRLRLLEFDCVMVRHR